MPQEIPFANKSSHKIMTVALAGNPNSGKTTIFNAFTKLRQKVGNYPGVTVEKKTGRLVLAHDRIINIIDLPGTYSLAVRSPDEKVARDVLMGRVEDVTRPDMVVCVVDASNLERNLYLVSQVQDLGLPVIVALNMMDEVKKRGDEIDIKKFEKLFNAPVVPMVASQNIGIEELKNKIGDGITFDYQRKWRMTDFVEKELEPLTQSLIANCGMNQFTAFSEALIMLSLPGSTTQQDEVSCQCLTDDSGNKVLDIARTIETRLKDQGIKFRSVMVEARYRWLKEIIEKIYKAKKQTDHNLTYKLDAVLTHKLWGWVFFIGLMGLMFFTIFSVASYPMEWIDSGFSYLSDFIKTSLPAGDARDLLTDGIIAGVGGVIIFLPQILILFLFIGILQDTGYMPRAAFIMDRVMSRVGLHGKSFIPLLSSFACAIPGIMAARTIESPKDRLVTILVAPLMSCSARLPVYTLMIAVLMPQTSALGKAGIMLGLYILGMVGACTMAWVFKSTLLKGKKPIFIMELPPYRLPSMKTTFLHMWERSRLFLKRAGTVILAMSIILWALMTYPKHEAVNDSQALKQSYAGQIGTLIEPVIEPLGYDWRIGIGLIGSFAAREVFVSTMNIVFNLDGDEEMHTLKDVFIKARWPDGRALFTPLTCISLMIFFVFAMQCLSTIAIMWRETNGWKWAAFQAFYMTFLAYFCSLIVFQGGHLLGFQ